MVRDSSIAERAYIAGILDGEAALQIYHHSHGVDGTVHYETSIRLRMVDLQPITLINEIYGGSVHSREARDTRWRDYWDLSINSFKDIKRLLNDVMPFLLIKKERALIMLRWIETRKDKRGYDEADMELVSVMHVMNRRGSLGGEAVEVVF